MAVAPAAWATEETVPVDVAASITSGFAGTRVDVIDMRAELDAFTFEVTATAGDKHLDMRGADELCERDVVS